MAYVKTVTYFKTIFTILLSSFVFFYAASVQADEGTQDGHSSVTLPITYYYDLITVRLEINGQGPYTFIIDTGATASALFSDVSEELGIKQNGEAVKNIHGVNAMEERPQLEPTEFKAGTFMLGKVHPIEAVAWTDKGRPAGIIGTDILGKYGVIIDAEKKEITITTPEAFNDLLEPSWKKTKTKSAPYGRKNDYKLMFLRLNIDGTDTFPAMLDTGSQITMINIPAANKLFAGYRITNGRKTWVHRDVLSERYINKILRLDRVYIGRSKWKNVSFFVKDMAALEILGVKKRPLLIVGMDLMKDRKFAINFPENQLYISEPIEINGENFLVQSWAYLDPAANTIESKQGL